MINHLRHMAVFAKVVDMGSFRAAAKELGLAPSRISHTISDLEAYLGVTLLYRTTRKLLLTNEGQILYAHVTDMMGNAEAGLNELSMLAQEPIGALKISLPAFMTTSTISAGIATFAHLYPKVSMSLNYTDNIQDILDEGIDLSIRVGWLENSSMMSRKLGGSKRRLVTSQRYLEEHSLPTHPSDLKDWDWIGFQRRPNTIELISNVGEICSIHQHSRVSVNSAEALQFMVRQNLGITVLPEHLVTECLSTGEFVHILPEWTLEPLGYYAVWPNKSRRENLTLLLVRFLAEYTSSTAKQLSRHRDI